MGFTGFEGHTHFNVICKNCEKRIGGCKCVASDKMNIKGELCDDCKESKSSQVTIRSDGPPYGDCYD